LNRSEKAWTMPPKGLVDGKGPVRRCLRRALHKGDGLTMFNAPDTPDSPPLPLPPRRNGPRRHPLAEVRRRGEAPTPRAAPHRQHRHLHISSAI
jgi:hypothetical protein